MITGSLRIDPMPTDPNWTAGFGVPPNCTGTRRNRIGGRWWLGDVRRQAMTALTFAE